MYRSKFDTLVTIDSIRNAWKKFWQVSHSQTTAGVDRITPQRFNSDIDKNLSSIFHDLKNGYKFQSLRPFPIVKPNGKKRIICIATVRDRIVQRLIAEHLADQAEKIGLLNAASFGFLKSTARVQRGVNAARAKAILYRGESEWAYKTDITAFFDRIDRERAVDDTIRALRAPSFRDIIHSCVSCEIDDSDPVLNRIAKENGIIRGLGIRQGMVLSPILSNVVLKDFDRQMLRQGYKMVRYADDLIVLADSHEECLKIDKFARKQLCRIELELPLLSDETKTEIVAPGDAIEFLGLSLQRGGNGKYHLILTPDHLAKISRNIFELKDLERLIREKTTFLTLGRRIENTIGGYRAAYSASQNISDLDDVLQSAKVNIIRSVLINSFGEAAVRKLNFEQRKFFGFE